jgi:hypothetical protein
LSGPHIAIVGFGTGRSLVKKVEDLDELWGINSLNSSVHCDLVFNMHTFPDIFESSEEYKDERMVQVQERSFEKACEDGTTVYTCAAWDRYPCLTPYPIDDIVSHFGIDYFTCTAAYALAYAIWKGVGRITLAGITGRESHIHQHPCLAFWLGVAMGRGIAVKSLSGGADLLRTEIQEFAPVLSQWRYGYHMYPPGADKEFTLHLDMWVDEIVEETVEEKAA